MQARRLRLMILGLVGLCILAGVALLVTVLNEGSQGPVYRGKHVSTWFREYAFSSNSLITGAFARGAVLTQISGGRSVAVFGPSNPATFPALTNLQVITRWTPARDPALDALQALGTNAVPYLLGQLQGIPFEPTYTRAFTNLPMLMQKKLPHPGERQYLRVRALEALGKIDDPSGMATPVLLDLLRKRDRFLRFALYGALRNSIVDRRLIGQVMLEFGAKGRNEDVIDIAENLGWQGEDVAKLLGTILKSPDPALRRRAIILLERAGAAAAPALDAVLLTLNDSDAEMRYMSARTLEAMGASSAEVVGALQGSLNDSNVMVKTLARRMLSNIASGTDPSER